MLLIDDYAEVKLIKRLEALRDDPKIARCIYIQLADTNISVEFKETIFALTQRYFSITDVQIYVCGDGDVFLLAPVIPAKIGKEFMLSIGAYLQRPVTNDWIDIYEISLQLTKLLLIVEQKIQKQKLAESEKRKQLDKQQQERRRQAILSRGTHATYDDIKSKRGSRETAELMIIEDDAFSRRLVENVLQKQYSLTGLQDANYALDTYARIAPDVLFLDINLPDVTGHELLDRILKIDPDAYIVMLSGNADRDNITHAMNKGAKGFIAKPFTKEKLFQYIERCPTLRHQPHH